jgi:hypothetical protein
VRKLAVRIGPIPRHATVSEAILDGRCFGAQVRKYILGVGWKTLGWNSGPLNGDEWDNKLIRDIYTFGMVMVLLSLLLVRSRA